jgi:penicillin-binding protein 1A
MLSNLIKIINIFFGLLIFVIVISLIVFYEYTKNLPSYEQIINYQPDTVINFYANDGEYLSSIFKENRIVLDSDHIPELVKNAIISAEDKDFYSNPGLDFGGILRSMVFNFYNYFSGSGKLSGGSTITQQIIKNTILSREKTFKRKIQEARLALGLNKYLSKDEILERYINHIYLGNNSYGFATAALNYFSKSINDLTIEEAALLAALPQAPSRMDPTRQDPDGHLILRRNWIISQMERQRFISKEDGDEAKKQPILLNKRSQITQKPLGIEYIVDEAKKKLISICGGSEDDIYPNGFSVYTTVNTKLQAMTTFALRKGLLDYEKNRYPWTGPNDHFKTKEEYFKFLRIANKIEIYPLKFSYVSGKDKNLIKIILSKDTPEIVITESNPKIFKNVQVGDVVTVFETNFTDLHDDIANALDDADKIKILQNKSFKIYQAPRVNGAIVVMDTKTGNILSMSGGFNYYKNQFNRATQALRQPGSSFKPLVYLTGLEHGFSPQSVLWDEPIEMDQGPGLPKWRPKNYSGDHLGAITMESSLEKSRNLSTLFLAQEIGIDAIVENAKKFGLLNPNSKERNYSIVFGSEEVTLLDMVRFYSIIANGGFDVKANVIDYVQNNKGETLWKNDNSVCECDANDDMLDSINPIPPLIKAADRVRLIDQRVDYQLLTMMEGVVKRGTASSLSYLGPNIAGKTGTSNDEKDVWFVGMNKDLAFGVYVGFDKPKSLGARATGSNTAIPVIKILLNHMKTDGYLKFDKPFYSDEELKELNVLENSLDNMKNNKENINPPYESYKPHKNAKHYRDYEIHAFDSGWVGD